MSTYQYKQGSTTMFVEVVSLDKDGRMTLKYNEVISTGVGKNLEIHQGPKRFWRRAERGSPEPVWELQASDGSWHPVQKHEVDTEVRMTWVSHNVEIKKSNKGKVKKKYVDLTNYAHWKERMGWARDTMLN